MSRKNQFRRVRNQFSILLALSRRDLSPGQFRCLLRIQLAADYIIRRQPLSDVVADRWTAVMEKQLLQLLQSLEKGTFSTVQLHPVVHLYGHLFLSGGVRSANFN